MSKHGQDLLADLKDLTTLGSSVLPDVADDITAAWADVPWSVSDLTKRGNARGADPGAALDAFISQINTALSTSATNVRSTGDAVIWCRNEFAATDQTCADYYHVTMHKLGGK